MALLRLIFCFIVLFYGFNSYAHKNKYSRYEFGISVSKPAVMIFNANIKNEFILRRAISNKPLAFQTSLGYENVNRQMPGNNDIKGTYLRAGVIFNLMIDSTFYKKPFRFHIGSNLFVNHYKHSIELKPDGQIANDYYFKKSVITQSVFAEAEVGVILFHSKNSKWRLEVINRAGIAIIKPRLNYYTNIRPGINKYNMNRLYATGGSICLFFKI
jgi:hypothetical protein